MFYLHHFLNVIPVAESKHAISAQEKKKRVSREKNTITKSHVMNIYARMTIFVLLFFLKFSQGKYIGTIEHGKIKQKLKQIKFRFSFSAGFRSSGNNWWANLKRFSNLKWMPSLVDATVFNHFNDCSFSKITKRPINMKVTVSYDELTKND